MTPRRRNLLVSGFVAAAALGAGVLVAPMMLKRVPGAEALGRARFADLQGKSHALSEWRGRVVILNFWATWCAPCLEEIPLLIATKRSNSGVQVVGIAVDLATKVSEFAVKLQIDYPILLTGADGLELIRNFGNPSGGLPFTVFLDRAGNPVRTKLGILRKPELDGILATLAGR